MLGAEYTVGVSILLAILAGVVSWGTVQIVKGAVKKYRMAKGYKKNPWWWSTVLRILAVFVGGSLGWLLAPDIWGIVIGVCAGILNTTMVAFVKGKLKSIAQDPTADLDNEGMNH